MSISARKKQAKAKGAYAFSIVLDGAPHSNGCSTHTPKDRGKADKGLHDDQAGSGCP